MISAVLVVTVLSLAQFGVASRYFLLDLEQKSASEKLAEGCVRLAQLYIIRDPLTTTASLPFGGVFPINGKTCTLQIIHSGSQSTAAAYAVTSKATTRYSVQFDTSTGNEGNVLSWTEM